MVWLPDSSWSPRAPLDDTSDGFSFHVKGGLVIMLHFRVFPNDGLGSFVGWPIFIFSPSPLGRTWAVMLAMLILGGICEQLTFSSPSPWSCMGYCGVDPWLVLVWCGSMARLGPPRAAPDDTSDGFSFHVKGWLVIELCFPVCLNDGLG